MKYRLLVDATLLVFFGILLQVLVKSTGDGSQLAGDDLMLNLSGCNDEEKIRCPPSGCKVCLNLTVKLSPGISLEMLSPQFSLNGATPSLLKTVTGDEQAHVTMIATGYIITFILNATHFMLNNTAIYFRAQITLYTLDKFNSNKFYIHQCQKPPEPSIKSVKLSSSMGPLELTVLLQIREDAAADGCFKQTFIAYIANSTGAVITTLNSPRFSNGRLVFIISNTDLSNQPPGLCVIIAAVSAGLEATSTCVALEKPVTNGTTILPTTIIPDVNTTSSNDLGIGIGVAVPISVLIAVVVVAVCWYMYRNRKRKRSDQCTDEELLTPSENNTSNEVQPQGRTGCGPTPAATAQELQQQIEAIELTTLEKEADHVTEIFRNPLEGEASTLGAGAEEPNGSMNEADMVANDGAGVGDPKCVKAEVEEEVKVEVHPVKNDPPNEVQPQGRPGCGSTLAAAFQGPQLTKDTNEHPVPMTDKVESEAVSEEEEAKDDAGAVNPKCVKEEVEEEVEVEVHPVKVKELGVIDTSFSEPTKERMLSAVEEPTGSESAAHMAPLTVAEVGEEGSNTTTKEQDVVPDEVVEPPPSSAAETEDETVEECESEGLENYAKVDDGGDDYKFGRTGRMPKAATSRSNTEKSDEQDRTLASGADASGGSDYCADGHIHPKEPSAPQAKAGETAQMAVNMNVTLSNMCDDTYVNAAGIQDLTSH